MCYVNGGFRLTNATAEPKFLSRMQRNLNMTQLLQEKTRHTNSYPATVRASMVCVTKSAMRAPELSASKTNEKFHQCQSNSATTGFYFVRFFLQTEQKYKISFPQNYMVRYPCYVRKKFDS